MAKIIPKLVYNGYEYVYHAVLPSEVAAHNSQYRGKSLGIPTTAQYTSIAKASFDDMFLGDYFTVNNHKYYIGGFDYLFGKDHNINLSHHILLLTDNVAGSSNTSGDNVGQPMNPTNTTTGGFANTQMWKTFFPTIVNQLQKDFGSHLLAWNEYLTTGTKALPSGSDSDVAASTGTWLSVQASMMNQMMFSGGSMYSTMASDGTNYNIGIENKELPLMLIHSASKQPSWGNFPTTEWLRDIYNSESFVGALAGDNDYEPASTKSAVRAFFLIG